MPDPAGPPAGAAAALVAAPQAAPQAACCQRKVIQINAKIAGTRGKRNPANVRPDNVLTSSSSHDQSLATNPPVILVRGCKEVEMEAITVPHGLPVTWRVIPNENTAGPPTVTPKEGGRKAILNTNVHGSFSVMATLDASKVVWNIVFVWVKVLVGTSKITLRNNKYADAGSQGGFTVFKSGDFANGQYPWEASVKVRVVGGGNSKTLGTDKVKLHILQNGRADTLTGHYAPPPPGSTAREVPRGGLPVRDSNGGGVGNPWMDNPTIIAPSNTAPRRSIWTADAPAGGFPSTHLHTGAVLQSISGRNAFTTAIASVSDDAPTALMVHAKTLWSAHFDGTVNAMGLYAPHGNKTTALKAFRLISPGTGGEDACDAGFETFEPRFNAGTDTDWHP